MTSAAYRYRALRADGGFELGEVDADGREAVAQLLGQRGLFPVSIDCREPSADARRRMPWSDLALGLRLLANLIRAGLPLDRALAALAESAPDPWRQVLPGITDQVRQGRPLGEVMADDFTGIPPLVAALVQAGEAGGGAAGSVERAASLAESIATTRAAIHQALVYPIILLGAGSLSLGFLVGVVLPRFAGILAELGQSPPATTRLVLGAAALARTGAVPLFMALAISFLLWRSWTSTAGGRLRWHRMLLALPLIGRARFTLATARATGAIGALLESGVTLPRALRHGAAASGDEAVTAGVLRAREAVTEGDSASRALAREEALSPTALRLVRAGEDTGRLGPMFLEAARIEHAAAERLVRRTVQLVEPAFILAFGGLVALVAAALLQALYSVRPS
jgi:general secretion pathway protein F